MNEFPKAVHDLRPTTKLRNDNTAAHLKISQLLYKMGDADESLKLVQLYAFYLQIRNKFATRQKFWNRMLIGVIGVRSGKDFTFEFMFKTVNARCSMTAERCFISDLWSTNRKRFACHYDRSVRTVNLCGLSLSTDLSLLIYIIFFI